MTTFGPSATATPMLFCSALTSAAPKPWTVLPKRWGGGGAAFGPHLPRKHLPSLPHIPPNRGGPE